MATLQTLSNNLNNAPYAAIPTPVGQEPVVKEFTYALAAALDDDDAIEAMWLPAFHVLVPSLIFLSADEVDSNASPLLLLNVGIAIAGTLDEDAIIDGATTGAAYNTQVGPNNPAFHDIGYSASNRKVIITVDQDPATDVTSGDIYLQIGYRAKNGADALTDA